MPQPSPKVPAGPMKYENWVVQWLPYIGSMLTLVNKKLDTLLTQEQKTMALLDGLTQEVANNTTIEQSVVALINGLAAQVAQNVADPAALQALVNQLQTNDQALAAAVTANTPPPAPAPAPASSAKGEAGTKHR